MESTWSCTYLCAANSNGRQTSSLVVAIISRWQFGMLTFIYNASSVAILDYSHCSSISMLPFFQLIINIRQAWHNLMLECSFCKKKRHSVQEHNVVCHFLTHYGCAMVLYSISWSMASDEWQTNRCNEDRFSSRPLRIRAL